jgi:hypothetical protein
VVVAEHDGGPLAVAEPRQRVEELVGRIGHRHGGRPVPVAPLKEPAAVVRAAGVDNGAPHVGAGVNDGPPAAVEADERVLSQVLGRLA